MNIRTMSRVGCTDSHWSLGNSGTSWKLQPRFDETWSLFPDTSKFFYWKKNARPSPRSPSGWRLGIVRHPKCEFREWCFWTAIAHWIMMDLKTKTPAPQKNVFFLCFVCFVSTAFQDLGVIFFQPNKNWSKAQFFRCMFFSAPFETICQNRLGRRLLVVFFV